MIRGLGVVATTALVVGNMIGSGIYVIPSSLADTAGPLGLVAWAINTAHHSDFADRGHAHIYQEGLRIPPVRLYRNGELQEDVQKLFLLNCQVPHERIGALSRRPSGRIIDVEGHLNHVRRLSQNARL